MSASEYKQQKKLWNKGRRKAARPFTGIGVTLIVVCIVCAVAYAVLGMMPAAFQLILSGTIYEVSNTDDSAICYESVYSSDEERIAAGEELSEEVEEEGITLLKNADDTLPIASGTKVSLFGYGSVDFTYGGTGSGGLDTSEVDSLKDGLEAAGLEVNATLWDFYETGDGAAESTVSSGSIADEDTEYMSYEPTLETFTDDVWTSVEEYSTVIFTISRIGGEGADLPTETSQSESGGYLALSDNERAVLQYLAELKEAGTVDSIIVLLNSSNTIQLDFVDDASYGVDAVLYVGGTGANGVAAIGSVLTGAVNPSGHLADTYLADNLSNPATVNFGAYEYEDAEELGLTEDDDNLYYVVYQEGIYVGYRYYETRYEDYVMGTGNAGSWDYSENVAYAFGSGLSYTTFAWSDYSVVYDETLDVFTVSVTVTNTGSVAGKDVVQIYAQSPYTEYDQENSVEKSSVVLVGYAKTDELAAGASQTLTTTVSGSELASYDAYGAGTYILDAGDYYLTAADDAHAAVNNILAAKGYSPANTSGRMDAEGDAAMVYGWSESALDTTTYSVSANGTTIENQFDNADINLSEYVEGQTITYLSRSDWEGTYPTEAYTLYATATIALELAEQRYDADTYDGVYAGSEMPTTGADNGLSAMDLYGLDYDDELWEDLLDQLTVEEMCQVLGLAFHSKAPIASVDLPGTRDENGPTGLTTALFGGWGDLTDFVAMGLPSEDIMASTWNVELLEQVGEQIGEDCLNAGVAYLYGPGANTHRSNYAGRNFEYFSEDSYLAGTICAAEVSGIESKGTHVMLKHFALNDQETQREGISTWANEQSIREIYLKSFQYALEGNELAGVMTAFNRIGCHWAGGNEGLIAGVLRGEWGNLGCSITDNSSMSNYYMNGVDMVLAGGDTADDMMTIEYDDLKAYADDPVVVTAMRDACHRVIYATLYSNAMNGMTTESTVKQVDTWYNNALKVAMVVTGVGGVVCCGLAINNTARYRRGNPKPKKKGFVQG